MNEHTSREIQRWLDEGAQQYTIPRDILEDLKERHFQMRVASAWHDRQLNRMRFLVNDMTAMVDRDEIEKQMRLTDKAERAYYRHKLHEWDPIYDAAPDHKDAHILVDFEQGFYIVLPEEQNEPTA